MPFLVSLFFAFAPALVMAWFVYWLDRYEKEPLALIGVAFFWGVVVAAGGAFVINTIFGVGIYALTGSENIADEATGALVAPFVEEGLKGLALVLIFFFFHNEFDSILDGIIYAGITALGFAAAENVLYIYQHGFVDGGGWDGLWQMVFIRDVLVAWQHPFFTAFTGIGLGVARMNKNPLVKIISVVSGYSMAVFAHALHNTLSSILDGLVGLAMGSIIDWTGWLFMFAFIIYMIVREGQILSRQLKGEAASGLISEAQYRTASSSFAQTGARMGALTSGHYRATARFYQVCGELALKKEELEKVGDEQGNTAIIASLRQELTALAPAARA